MGPFAINCGRSPARSGWVLHRGKGHAALCGSSFGSAARRFGTRPTFWTALALAGLGLPLLLLPNLAAVIIGLMLVGIGTFFAQAAATGFVGRAATSDRGSASGIYLACYFFGGLVGTAVLGQIFDRFGWWACVMGIALALATAAHLAIHLRLRCDESTA
jgi:MFS transporter, YNFM family, putative membrane transport protein